ncbi:mtDNA inheritance, partitioning of the mitochondrial organelle [Tieghemiomyces parasiticus]|uniref:MtDNA inheritance, partitioning of the mitochondrial organelle n=1 Tax=Tieghemiomyces parasiticus TaxID=78921 RepID=A0A9W8AA89_9FUNG|nr:mtDNA inheritance, partitioning of the mitochondrial organelle [Tieghemiomyces parasiticus]
MHEIITLQFGELANYVGSHFWNIQQAYPADDASQIPSQPVDHGVLFRSNGGGPGGQSWTPRVLIYDLKPNFGSLCQYTGAATTAAKPELTPTGGQQHVLQGLARSYDAGGQRVAVHTQDPVTPSDYLRTLDSPLPAPTTTPQPSTSTAHGDLANDVRYWSDYGESYYHPGAFYPDFSTLSVNGALNDFADYQQGQELFRTQWKQGELNEDALRRCVEEADTLQGFQILANTLDGFGGYASAYLEYLQDEYAKEPILTFGIAEGTGQSYSDRQRLNQLLALRGLAGDSDHGVHLPLQMPDLASLRAFGWTAEPTRHSNFKYLGGAVLAAFVDTLTLPCRTGQTALHSLVRHLEGSQRCGILAGLQSFPSPVVEWPGADQSIRDVVERGTLQDVSVFQGPLSRTSATSQEILLSAVQINRRAAVHGTAGTSDTARFDLPVPLPLPGSFPAMFRAASSVNSKATATDELPTLDGLAVATARTSQAQWFGDSAHWLRQQTNTGATHHQDRDELLELREFLEDLDQRYTVYDNM